VSQLQALEESDSKYVNDFLTHSGFDSKVKETFKDYTGAQLLGLDKDDLTGMLGAKDAQKLWELLSPEAFLEPVSPKSPKSPYSPTLPTIPTTTSLTPSSLVS